MTKTRRLLLWLGIIATYAISGALLWAQRPRPLPLYAQVDLLYAEGQVDEAMELLSKHKRSELPEEWDPPPRSYTQAHLLFRILDLPVSPWVRRAMVEKVERYAQRSEQLPVQQLRELERALRKMTEGPGIVKRNEQVFDAALDSPLTDDKSKPVLRAILAPTGRFTRAKESRLANESRASCN